MDGSFIELGHFRLLGCPYHGLVRGNRLTLPNGSHIDGQFSAVGSRGSVRFAVPGVAAIARAPEEAAYDVANGYQWRPDAAIQLNGDEIEGLLYGLRPTHGESLYAAGVGNCWSVALPYARYGTAGNTVLTEPATVTAFGRIGYSPTAIEHTVPVALEGYGGLDTTYPSLPRQPIDALPDGSRVVLADVRNNERFELRMTDETAGFALLKVSGDGAAPFGVTLELLSEIGAANATVVTDTLVRHDKYLRWQFDETVTKVDEGRDCESDRRVYGPARLVAVPPYGSPSSHWIGEREARLDGYVIGYWFLADGTLQPVTIDYRYRLESDYTWHGIGNGAPNRSVLMRYAPVLGVCQPLPSVDPDYILVEEEGVYTWDYETRQTTTEEIEIVLRVDGAEIDRHLIQYQRENSTVISGAGDWAFTSGGIIAAIDSTANYETVETLTLDGVEHDRIESSSTAIVEDPYPPTSLIVRRIDTLNRFEGGGEPHEWLPIVAQGQIKLGVGYSKIWACVVHWWSNRLVCLREEFRAAPDYTVTDRYGYTAYPGGVTGSRINPVEFLPSGNAAPLYGALNPFGGTPLLGQTDKITYI
jgi:hypothetical protein